MAHILRTSLPALLLLTPTLFADNWPGWRGPLGNGVSPEKNLPVKWSKDSGIVWKTEMPGRSNATPAIWGSRVFVTSETTPGDVAALCVSATDGEIRWQKTMPRGTAPGLHQKNSLATASPVTDGKCAYFMFATGVLACLDMNGKSKWGKELGPLRIQYGPASSPLLYRRVVIQTLEQGRGTKIVALDKSSGRQAWSIDDAPRGGWSSPVAVPVGRGRDLIVRNNSTICAYDPRSGKEVWSVPGMKPAVSPTVTFDDGILFATSGRNGPVFAINPATGRGVWQIPAGGPYVPSPVAYDDRYYHVDDNGALLCVDFDGDVVYRGNIKGPFTASPVAGDGKVYFTNERGLVTVINATSDKLEILAENDLGEPVLASPAISDGCIYFRSARSLYCVGARKAEAGPDEEPAPGAAVRCKKIRPQDLAIDGDLSDWRKLNVQPITVEKAENVVHGKDAWKDKQDLSLQAYLAWDGGFFYLAVKVSDDVIYVDDLRLTAGDAIELCVDTRSGKDFRADPSAGFYKMLLIPALGLVRRANLILTYPPKGTLIYRPERGILETLASAVSKREGCYIVEAKIPIGDFRQPGPQWRSGVQLGIDLAVTDADESEEIETVLRCYATKDKVTEVGAMVLE